MKKIEEKYLESEHQVKAKKYEVYLNSARTKTRSVSVYILYEGKKEIYRSFCILDGKSKFLGMQYCVNAAMSHCENADLVTIKVANSSFANSLRVGKPMLNQEIYAKLMDTYNEAKEECKIELDVIGKDLQSRKYVATRKYIWKLFSTIPSASEFMQYCNHKNWVEDGFQRDLWRILCERRWKTNDGELIKDWHTLADEINSLLRTGKNAKYGKVQPKKEETIVKRKRPLPNYICYTDGSCDNYSTHKAGGSAYIVVNTSTGELEKVKTHHCLHTTSNRMEMLAIISAVNYCPKGSVIEVRSDSKYALKMFRYTDWEIGADIKNPDLIKLYRKCAKDKLVILTWVKGHNGDDLNEQADCLAFGAYEKALKENGLPMAPEKYRVLRRGKQTVFETDN